MGETIRDPRNPIEKKPNTTNSPQCRAGSGQKSIQSYTNLNYGTSDTVVPNAKKMSRD